MLTFEIYISRVRKEPEIPSSNLGLVKTTPRTVSKGHVAKWMNAPVSDTFFFFVCVCVFLLLLLLLLLLRWHIISAFFFFFFFVVGGKKERKNASKKKRRLEGERRDAQKPVYVLYSLSLSLATAHRRDLPKRPPWKKDSWSSSHSSRSQKSGEKRIRKDYTETIIRSDTRAR